MTQFAKKWEVYNEGDDIPPYPNMFCDNRAKNDWYPGRVFRRAITPKLYRYTLAYDSTTDLIFSNEYLPRSQEFVIECEKDESGNLNLSTIKFVLQQEISWKK